MIAKYTICDRCGKEYFMNRAYRLANPDGRPGALTGVSITICRRYIAKTLDLCDYCQRDFVRDFMKCAESPSDIRLEEMDDED